MFSLDEEWSKSHLSGSSRDQNKLTAGLKACSTREGCDKLTVCPTIAASFHRVEAGFMPAGQAAEDRTDSAQARKNGILHSLE